MGMGEASAPAPCGRLGMVLPVPITLQSDLKRQPVRFYLRFQQSDDSRYTSL